MKKLPLLTTNELPGKKLEYLGMVWGTSVRAKNLAEDLVSLGRSIIGGEVVPYTRMVNEAKHDVLTRLSKNAHKMGADAVVGVRLSSNQITPGTIEIFAYGTAVKFKKK